MTLSCLRDGLPPTSSFTVTQRPHRIKLDQNEAPLDLPESLKRELGAALAARAWNRYPQPAAYARARRALADALSLDPDRVLLTVGGDQTILSAFHVAGGPGRRARWFEPAYPYVALAARVTHTEGDPVQLGPRFEAGIDAAAALAAPAPDLSVFVSPGNPTGCRVPRATIDAALAEPRRLVFVNEAYADFAPDSLLAEAGGIENLMVGRSLSKALLAYVRLGFVVAHPDIVAALEQLYTAPYHLNGLQLEVAARYGEIRPHVTRAVAAVVAERARLSAALAALDGVRVHPSEASFVLFHVGERAAAIHAALAAAGVRIRDVSRLPGLAGHLRVTVGTPDEDDGFVAALRDALAGAWPL